MDNAHQPNPSIGTLGGAARLAVKALLFKLSMRSLAPGKF
jgi:hypothetical protein